MITLIPLSELSLHPQADLIPDGTAQENEALLADIQVNGVQKPLDINPSKVILDGRRRYNAAKALGLTALPCLTVDEADEIAYLYRCAILRRNLAEFARFELSRSYRDYLSQQAKQNQRAAGGAVRQKSDEPKATKPLNTNKALGELLGVSHDTVGKFKFLDRHANPDEKQALRTKQVTTHKAYEAVKKRVTVERRQRQAEAAVAARPPYQYDEGEGWENKVIRGDSREVLKVVPDGAATLVLFSPPYPTELVRYDVYQYDRYWKLLRLVYAVLRQSFRALRDGGRVVIDLDQTSANQGSRDTAKMGKRDFEYDVKTLAYRLGFKYFDDAVWYKQNTVGSNGRKAVGTPFDPTNPSVRRNHECILMFYKGSRELAGDDSLNDPLADYFDHFTISGWNYDAANRKEADTTIWSWWYIDHHHRTPGLHPCPFPERLVELCLCCLTRRGDLVIDPFNGSGTTTAVAQRLGRRFLGIDLSEAYCAEAQARLEKVPINTLAHDPVGK